MTLNNDTILITPDWLERMVSLAALPDVGIVGACLLDQYGKREHESIVISPYPQHSAHRLQLSPRRSVLAFDARRRRGDRRGADGKSRVLELTRRHGRTLGGHDERRRPVPARPERHRLRASTPRTCN